MRARTTYISFCFVFLGLCAACTGPSQNTLDPDRTETRTRIYEAYTRAQLARFLGDYETAITHAELAVELEPFNGELVLLLGQLYRESARYLEAIAALQEGILQVKHPVALYLELAESQMLARDDLGAETSLNLAIESAPDRLDVHDELAELLVRTGRDLDALALLQTFSEDHPEQAEAWRSLGVWANRIGDLPLALSAFDQANQLDNNTEGDYVALVSITRELGAFEQERLYFEACVHQFRRSVDCRIEHLRTLEAQTTDPEELRLEGFQTLQPLGRAIGADPGQLRRVERRLINELDGQYALLFLQTVAADRPRNTQIQTMTAWAAYRIEDEETACEHMWIVLEVRPRDADALNFIGYSYAEREVNLEQAEELVLSALEIRPNDGNIQDSMGWVYYKLARYEEAIEWLELANENLPGHAVLVDHLGDAYRAQGNLVRALELYQEALELVDDEELEQLIRIKIEEIEPVGAS